MSTTAKCARPACPNRAPNGYRGYCHKHGRALGLVREKVDAAPSRKIIQDMLDEGWSYRAIADSAGLPRGTVRHVITKGYPKVRQSTHDALHNMELKPAFVPSWRAARRVQALRAAGFITKEIADGVGTSRSMIVNLCDETYATTTIDLFERVDTFYREHEAEPVRPPHPRTAKHRWPLPMEWVDIDDPQERRAPYTLAEMEDRVPVTPQDREVAVWLMTIYRNLAEAGRASGAGESTVQRCCAWNPGVRGKYASATREALRRMWYHAQQLGYRADMEVAA